MPISLGIFQWNFRPANSPCASPPTCTVNGGAALWKNCSAWSLEKMIHRSGLSARSLLPMSAATSRTCATTALSSVSGMVKNWGACGSMAPPTTVDIIGLLLDLGAASAGARHNDRASFFPCEDEGGRLPNHANSPTRLALESPTASSQGTAMTEVPI